MADAPQWLAAAFIGFLAADATLIFAAGLCLPCGASFFTHGVAVTRAVGVLFIAFGAKSLFDAARGLTGTVGRVFRKRFRPIKGLRRGFQPPRASATSQAIAS